jgi:hypothetical protein
MLHQRAHARGGAVAQQRGDGGGGNALEDEVCMGSVSDSTLAGEFQRRVAAVRQYQPERDGDVQRPSTVVRRPVSGSPR